MKKLLVISFDAVTDSDFLEMAQEYRNIGHFLQSATFVRDVSSIFPTNTYSVHTSVATGQLPREHGIIANNLLAPELPRPPWVWDSRRIKAKTIWQAANEKGLRVASVLWPVTGYAKEIKYNVPEIPDRNGLKLVADSLRSGSPFLLLSALLRHGKCLKAFDQPGLDRFSTGVMLDVIRKHHPDLMLLHLTAFDTLCHRHGKDKTALRAACEALDENVGLLMNAVDSDTEVIIFSDHGQLDVKQVVNPNQTLAEQGLCTVKKAGGISDYKCFFECCGGSAFFHNVGADDVEIEMIKEAVKRQPFFRRFLTEEELSVSGRGALLFGIAAKPGFCYENRPKKEKGNHGYPLDTENYRVFYAIKGDRFEPKTLSGGTLLDLTSLIVYAMDLDIPERQGQLKEGIGVTG